MKSEHHGTRGIAVAAALTIAALAWPATARADCQFEIRATNDLNKDAYVLLYDATVVRYVFGAKVVQLKIQNHRIAPGKAMDRRYTARGKCPTKRTWIVPHRVGTANGKKVVLTEGTSSTSRTVDLGRASQWTGSSN